MSYKSRKGTLCSLSAIMLPLLFNSTTQASSLDRSWINQTYNPNVKGIDDNPLRGFVPYAPTGSSFPHSMESFYIPLNSVVMGPNQYDWAPLESQLNQIASDGNQAVFRFYLDYPGQASGIPSFLIKQGLKTNSYDDYGNKISKDPDWNNPLLMKTLINFVHEFGHKFDGDPRIAFITTGLYGYWGEWHTYPETQWEMSVLNQERLLQAYVQSFHKTQLLTRYPNATPDTQLMHHFGFHDDSFAEDTLGPTGGWQFWPAMEQANLTDDWKTHPVGGELFPQLQGTMWNTWPNATGDAAGGAQDFEASAETTHVTWLMNDWMFAYTPTNTQYANALRADRLLGYRLFVSAVSLSRINSKQPLRVSVKIQDRGVAPFYYNWPVQLAAVDSKNEIRDVWPTNWDITRVLPGNTDTLFNWSVQQPNLSPGAYHLVMRVVNPLKNGKSLRFANYTQDTTKSGWLTLGSMTVSKSPIRSRGG